MSAAIFLVLCSLAGVTLVWLLPRQVAMNAFALLSASALVALSPASALWLAGTTATTVLLVRHVKNERLRGPLVLVYAAVLVYLLFQSREIGTIFWVGGAYFTLRQLHTLIDWWMGRLTRAPGVAEYFRYQFFLPVLMSGPIHRFDHFQRQIRRQRLSAPDLFRGAERILVGLAMAVVVAGWALSRLSRASRPIVSGWPEFFRLWLEGGMEWLHMYFSFAGFTSVALGLSLMMGLKLEENFNRPWAAKDLIDFWSRWHMTLSNWCRDYVFHPVTAVTRLPLAGLLAAMLAMGLWHDTTAYYVLWAVWQSLGIFLTHMARRLPVNFLPGSLVRILGSVSVLAWLSLTRPVVTKVLELFSA